MHGMNWLRIGLCGILAGVVWFVLSALPLSLVAQDFVASVHGTGPHPPKGGGYFFAIDLAMGVWAVWLYAAISLRYGERSATAVIAGVAWWIIKSLQSAKWAGLGFVPDRVVVVPLATTLVAAVVATVVGAWLYSRVGPKATTGEPVE